MNRLRELWLRFVLWAASILGGCETAFVARPPQPGMRVVPGGFEDFPPELQERVRAELRAHLRAQLENQRDHVFLRLLRHAVTCASCRATVHEGDCIALPEAWTLCEEGAEIRESLRGLDAREPTDEDAGEEWKR